jgi:uncharacterized protein (TIGR03086 family)
MPTLLELLDESLVYAAEVLAGIEPAYGDAATPCPDFTVDHLVEHLVNGLAWYAGLPAGGEADPRDVRGPDPRETGYVNALASVVADVRQNWSTRLLGEKLTLPFGTVTGAGMTQYTIIEVLAHGWDLAVATKQPNRPPEELAEQALAVAQELDEETLRSPGMMADQVPVEAGAPPMDRFVAFLGRQPV